MKSKSLKDAPRINSSFQNFNGRLNFFSLNLIILNIEIAYSSVSGVKMMKGSK